MPAETGKVKPVKADAKERKRSEMVHEGAYSNATVTRRGATHFTLQWSKGKTDALRPLFQQQWNFSPSGSTRQIEDYEVDLDSVWVLQVVIDPDIAGGTSRCLSRERIG